MKIARQVSAAFVLSGLLAGTPAAATEWPMYAGGPRRLFFNPAETLITPANVSDLRVKWSFPTEAIVTASPAVATLVLPGEGRTAVAFIASWDDNLYALRMRDGTALWRFPMADQPGASFPDAGSADVETIDGRPRVFIAGGETVYSIDAVTGREVWHFEAGTGCRIPGDCGFRGETNEVESSPIVAGGTVLFGMDLNENGIQGKGGFYGIDVHDGRLLWYFDLETGATCRTLPGDDVRRFDGYHTESELGLPPGFLATRPGCAFARSGTGCSGVWSSAAVDEGRDLLFFGTSACFDDANALPYEEAIVALRLDGTPAWHWKPRPTDTLDRDFGAVPNLFTITVGGAPHDVVGEGGKDGTYYVLDREGVNAVTGARWDDADPSGLPYWRTQVVPGGEAGGIIATAAVDEKERRVYFSTAPGTFDDVFSPQEPTVHALDLDTGAIVWETNADSSFAPTSAIPGVVFVGKELGAVLRAYDAGTGAKLTNITVPMGITLASAPAVVDGTVIVGAGAGERSDDPTDEGNIAAHQPQNVTAFCAAGTAGCDPVPGDRCDEGGSAPADAAALLAARAAGEASCPCVAFDGTQGGTYGDYVHCVRRVLGTLIAAGTLRGRCRPRAERALTHSICGRPGTVVCCESRPDTQCLVVPRAECVSSGRQKRTSCSPATACAATTCRATGVCAAGG